MEEEFTMGHHSAGDRRQVADGIGSCALTSLVYKMQSRSLGIGF
jgi:hypothetical protein